MTAVADMDRPRPWERGGRTVERRQAPVLAALDLGTNNCRLLVARPAPGGFRVIDAFSRIVRLGEGLSQTDSLSETAMDRTVEALQVCAAKVRRRGVTALRAVATEACRRAANCMSFLDRVQAETGLQVEIISAEEEARLALAGCAPLLNPKIRHALVFDIGGGSTEVMWLELLGRQSLRLIDQVSVPLGVVNMTEMYGGDRVTRTEYDQMVEDVRHRLDDFARRIRIGRMIERGGVQMLGASGTVTTLASLHMDLPRYDRSRVDGTFLSFEAARHISHDLVGMDFGARARHPCIGVDRADLVVSGCAILEAICLTWPVGRLRIADRGVREGILMDLIRQGRHWRN